MIKKTTAANTGIAAAKISAQETLTVNAMTIAPNTINGLRSNRRSARFSPFWIWLISSVRRVISVPVPRRSSSS